MPKFPIRKENNNRIKGRGDATVCDDRISILKHGNKKHYCPEVPSPIKRKTNGY